MEQKKLSKAQLESRLKNALIHIDKTKDTQTLFFSDKGLRLTTTDEFAIVATNNHSHLFSAITPNGYSHPYLFVKRFLEIALENAPKTENGYSYAKLFEELKNKEDKSEYNVAFYCDMYFFNIFCPLYTIGDNEASAFTVYESYLHNIAVNSVILSEKVDGLTNKQFLENIIANIREYSKDIDERVIYEKKTDAEIIQEEINAMSEIENENNFANELGNSK